MSRAERGVSLIELIIFIVVVGVAVVGVLAAINLGTRSSADPMVQKQALAAAEALLEEVMLKPFTICDPDDAAATNATTANDCTGLAGGPNDESRIDPPAGSFPGGLGPDPAPLIPPVEARSSTTFPFDNVGDYNGYDSADAGGIRDISGTLVTALAGYRARILVTQQGLDTIPIERALLIRVQVDGPAGTEVSVVLHGYRVRYAPNALP